MEVARRIERDGMTAFHRAVPPPLAAARGIELAEIAGAACSVVRSEPASTLTNRATGLGLDAPVTDGILESVEAFFAGARYAVDGELPALATRGFERGEDTAVFVRGVDRYAHAAGALEIVEAGAAAGAEFGALCGEASGTPPFLAEWFGSIVGRAGWHCFFAVDGETPVATGALFAARDGGWLGFGATVPAHRRRGAQSALLAARIGRARELGLSTVVASTGAAGAGDSYRNLERAGFRLAGLEPRWVSPG